MNRYKVTNQWGRVQYVVTDCWLNITPLTGWAHFEIATIERTL